MRPGPIATPGCLRTPSANNSLLNLKVATDGVSSRRIPHFWFERQITPSAELEFGEPFLRALCAGHLASEGERYEDEHESAACRAARCQKQGSAVAGCSYQAVQ